MDKQGFQTMLEGKQSARPKDGIRPGIGRTQESVLQGDDRCRFAIHLPEVLVKA